MPPNHQWICTSLHGITCKTIVLIGSLYSLNLAGYLFGLHLDPEDGGSTFVRNVRGHSPGYTLLHPRIKYS
jgi:hypothetical protein